MRSSPRCRVCGNSGSATNAAVHVTTQCVDVEGVNMKQPYDFSHGERGKFYRENATFKLPVYLDAEVEHYLTQKAEHKGIELSDLVNQLLKKEIEIIEAVQ